MTTQADVVSAFARRESAPNVASNLRRLESDHGGREYLCGGSDGTEVVLAQYDPIGIFTTFRTVAWGSHSMRHGYMRRQARIVSQRLRSYVEDNEPSTLYEESRQAPETNSIEDIIT